MAEEDTVLDSGLKKTLTPQEYQTSFVDFYKQTLGSTGIDVGDDDDEEEEKKEDAGPRVITEQGGGGDNDFVSYSVLKGSDESTRELDIVNTELYDQSVTSYKDLLNKNNSKDLVSFDDFNITFSKPSKEALKKQGYATSVGAMVGSPFVMGEILGIAAGEERIEVDGKTGLRPPNALGLAYDANMSRQTINVVQRNNNINFNKNEAEMADAMGTTPSFKTTGFSARINGQLVSRRPGSINYDGVYNYTTEQLKNLEATRRGLNPYGFNLKTETSDGGDIINTGVDRGYTQRGTYADINGIAAAGPEREFQNLVSRTITQNGLDASTDKKRKDIEVAVRGGLTKTRQGYTFLGSKKEGAKTLSENIKEAITPFKTQTTTATSSDNEQKKSSDVVAQVDSFQDYTPPSGGGYADMSDPSQGDDNNQSNASSGTDYGNTGTPETSGLFKRGGRVGMKNGGNTTEVVQPAGFISPDANATDQQEIADDKPMDAKNGDFIINAPAAEEAGKQDIQRMINTAITNLQEKGVDVRFGDPKINIGDKVKLLVSRNEVYIPAIIAKEIGYDRLKKINNRGKREVQRRQEESQRDEKPQARGFIQKKKGDVVDVTQRPDFKEADYLRSFPAELLASVTGVYNDSQKANLHARDYAKKYKPKDDDRSEDSLRHILGGGYMSDSIFKLPGYTGYNMREFGAFMDSIVGKKGTDPAGEESRIDLNNNRYGRVLRQKYPDENKFKAKAIEIARKLSQGKKGPVIDGISPMLSLGSEEATRRKKQQLKDMEYQVN